MNDDTASDDDEWAFGPWALRLPGGPLLRDGVPQALGGRALSMLTLLVRHRGALVPTQALLEHVWPGRVVEEGNLYVQVAELRKLLGRDAVGSVYGQGYRLALPVVRAIAAAPLDGAALYGRDVELAALQAAHASHALVSIVGMGGIGKSALARALARQAGAGACWVELAALPGDLGPGDDAAATPLAAAALQALGIAAGSTPPVRRLLEAFGEPPDAWAPPSLLVLDNCEHVAAAAAHLVTSLRAAAPHLRIVATSQTPLKLQDEHVLALGPLALPDAPRLPIARASGAVALFVARARAVQPRFALSDDNLGDVLDICVRLEGIPLALELAAARVPLLGAAGIAQRLGERFRLLSRGPDAVPERHRSLQAALDWSHALLTPRERRVLRRLSVFRGGFTADAAQHVARDDDPLDGTPGGRDDSMRDDTLDGWAVLEVLARLVELSFVVPHNAGTPDAPRFTLLDTVREHAARGLRDAGEAEALSRRHVEHFAGLARATDGLVGGKRFEERCACVGADLDNLRAALDACVRRDPVLGLDIATSLGSFWRVRGHHLEALQRIEALLARTEQPVYAAARARLLPRAAMLAMECADVVLVRRLAGEAAQIGLRTGHAELEAQAHTLLGHAASLVGEQSSARESFVRSLAIRREQGDLKRVAEELNNIASTWIDEDEPSRAQPLLDEALLTAREAGHRWAEAVVLETMGEVSFALGRFEAARDLFTANLAIQRELQHAYRILYGLAVLACAELQLGRAEVAAAALCEALSIGRRHGLAIRTVQLFAVAAACLAALDRSGEATQLLGALDALAPVSAVPLQRTERTLHSQALAQTRASLDERAWQQRWFEGRRRSRDDAMARALDWLARPDGG